MSSPFAQKFMGKNPFTQNKDINPEAGGKDYEAIGDEARKLEKKYSADRGDAPCLLYTSPSPRDGLLSRMPSSA